MAFSATVNIINGYLELPVLETDQEFFSNSRNYIAPGINRPMVDIGTFIGGIMVLWLDSSEYR